MVEQPVVKNHLGAARNFLAVNLEVVAAGQRGFYAHCRQGFLYRGQKGRKAGFAP